MRNEPIRIATLTIIAIATMSDATATLLRRSDEPRFAAPMRAAGEKREPNRFAAAATPAIASGTQSDAPKMIASPAA